MRKNEMSREGRKERKKGGRGGGEEREGSVSVSFPIYSGKGGGRSKGGKQRGRLEGFGGGAMLALRLLT